MLGTCLPSRHAPGTRPAAPATSKDHTGGALNGRTLSAASPASPRISRHSTWWAALTHGGFKGLHQWIVRTRQDRGLSVADRIAKPDMAKKALQQELQNSDIASQQWSSNLNAKLEDAIWYEVDVDKAIGNAFSAMDNGKIVALQNACRADKSLAWLAEKLNKRLAATTALKVHLKHVVEKSMALSNNGSPLHGSSQNTLWAEADKFFDASFGCNLQELAQDVVADGSISKLLPLAAHHLKNRSGNSRLLAIFCEHAFNQVKGKNTIRLDSLNDKELEFLSELSKDSGFKLPAGALSKEMLERKNISKRHDAASYFNAQLLELAGKDSPNQQAKPRMPARVPYPDLKKNVISKIIESVIAKADPEIIVRVAKMESANPKVSRLIMAAKKQLECPTANDLAHTHLLSYLRLSDEEISSSARELLESEAKKRIELANQESMAFLMAGIKSDSCRRLVGAAMEFATLDKMKAELQDVVSEDFFPDPKTFLNFAKDLKPSQILDLQELALQMDRRGQTDISKRLTSLINKLGRQRYLAPSAREARAMEEAISQFFPKAGAAHSHPLITAVNDELKGKYYSALLISHYDEDLVKKAKNDAGELPVSIQFDKDQRTRNVRIAGGLIDGHSIPNQSDEKTRRTQEFVNVMREKKFTDLQIMKASHIACQNTCSVLASLIYEENMLALNDFEKEQGGDAAKGISNAGLIPTGLEQDAHLNRNSNGNLEMRVQIFKENVETWRGMRPEDCITTDPLNSSFLAELNFVIDEKGEVITEATTFQMGYQREITQIGPQE